MPTYEHLLPVSEPPLPAPLSAANLRPASVALYVICRDSIDFPPQPQGLRPCLSWQAERLAPGACTPS